MYCGNNPIKFVVPSGLRTFIINGINNTNGESGPVYAQNLESKLEESGIKDVQIIPVYKVKEPKNNIGLVLNSLSGGIQVVGEMLGINTISNDVLSLIKTSLANDPLDKNEELNIIGYSGGGQIALNVANKLDGIAEIDNIVLIGTPIFSANSTNTGQITEIYSDDDNLSHKFQWWDNVNRVEIEGASHHGEGGYFGDDYIDKTVEIINSAID